MIDKIVQMSIREYETLKRKADMKDKEIEKEAVNLWKEKGVATLSVSISANDHDPYEVKIDCSSSVWYRDEKFFIPDKMRERLRKLCTDMVQGEIDRYIGEPIKIHNKYHELRHELEKWFRVLVLIAASGWAVAAMVFLS